MSRRGSLSCILWALLDLTKGQSVSVQLGSRGIKQFPGQKKGVCGVSGVIWGGEFAMHLLAFIFVLGLLFIFLMPFFTVAAVFRGHAAVCSA